MPDGFKAFCRAGSHPYRGPVTAIATRECLPFILPSKCQQGSDVVRAGTELDVVDVFQLQMGVNDCGFTQGGRRDVRMGVPNKHESDENPQCNPKPRESDHLTPPSLPHCIQSGNRKNGQGVAVSGTLTRQVDSGYACTTRHLPQHSHEND